MHSIIDGIPLGGYGLIDDCCTGIGPVPRPAKAKDAEESAQAGGAGDGGSSSARAVMEDVPLGYEPLELGAARPVSDVIQGDDGV